MRQLLVDKLGKTDAERFSDSHIQILWDKAYTDEGALQDATREGFQASPGLPAALIDKLLKALWQTGEEVLDVLINTYTSLYMQSPTAYFCIMSATLVSISGRRVYCNSLFSLAGSCWVLCATYLHFGLVLEIAVCCVSAGEVSVDLAGYLQVECSLTLCCRHRA